MADSPPGDRVPCCNRFTPAMKHRRKRFEVDSDRDRPNENCIEYGFRDEQLDELLLHSALWWGFGRVFCGNNPGQRVRNSLRTSSSTSSAVAALRHLSATSLASSTLICERTPLTRGISAGIMLRSIVPNPSSHTAYAGGDAISPQTSTGIDASRAACSVRVIP